MIPSNIINILIVVGVLFGVFMLYKWFAPYFVRITTVFYVSGSMGTGKDVLSHKYALSRYRVAYRKYKFQKLALKFTNLFRKKKNKKVMLEKPPMFLSSVPVLIKYGRKGKHIISHELTLDTVLLKERMPHGSVVYISDINRMINQWAYKNENVITHVAEYITMFRQYTKGGYIIVNSQASFQVAKEIRGLFGKIRNNLSFKKFLFFYRIEGRTITMAEEVVNVEQGDADQKNVNVTYIYGILNPFIRRYDTYAYYGRVSDMEVHEGKRFKKANTNYFLDIPVQKVKSNVCNEDNDYKVAYKLEVKSLILYGILFFILGIVLSALFKSGLPFMILVTIYTLLYLDAVM